MVKIEETLDTETPPPSKRPRRSATLPKPKEDKKPEEPKAKRPKNTPKKDVKSTPKKESKISKPQEPETENDETEEPEAGSPKRKESSDSDVIEEFIDCEYLKDEIIAVRADESEFYLAECCSNIQEKDLDKDFKVNYKVFACPIFNLIIVGAVVRRYRRAGSI